MVGGSQDNGTELTTGNPVWTETDGGDGGYSQISQTNANICYSNHPIGSFGVDCLFPSLHGRMQHLGIPDAFDK